MQNFEAYQFNMPEPIFQDILAIEIILQAELATIEAYQHLLKDLNIEEEIKIMKTIVEDHRYAADYWKEELNSFDEYPVHLSGVWIKAVETFIKGAALLGNYYAIVLLKKGEEYAVDYYESMLESFQITASQKKTVQNVFLPANKQHIRCLQKFNLKKEFS
jgi:rubrerythrin